MNFEKAWEIVLEELKKHGNFYNNLKKQMFDRINTPDMMADADPEYIVDAILREMIGEE